MTRHDSAPARPPKHRRGPRAGGRPKIDWSDAFAYFAASVTTGFQDVADRYAVSRTAVRKHARPGGDYPEGWEERRRQLVARAAERSDASLVRALERRREDTIRVAELLRRRVLALDELDEEEFLAQLELALALRELPHYAKLEELYAGEATDRPDLGEVKTVIFAVVKTAGRFVPREQREAFLAELEGATGGLLAIEGGEAA